MSGGTWNPISLPNQPGLYLNFVESAVAQIQGGSRGTVAIPLLSYSGSAEAGKVYSIEKESEAIQLFDTEGVQSIQLALQGGAKEVLVYTMPESPQEADYATMRDVLDTYPFNVFVFDGEADATQQTNIQTWVENNRGDGKHFLAVLGRNDDSDAPVTRQYGDDYIIHLINGVSKEEKEFTSAQFAPYIAGHIAGTAINKSITYSQVFVDDVNVRYKNSDVKTALDNGGLVLVHDGDKVKIEQGITSSGIKIRAIGARQAVATDIAKTAADSYIGKLDNNEDGQKALISAIKAYLETLENANVLTDIFVELDPDRASVGDSVFLRISYRELDSMERIFLNINI
ncbi:phage tail sheath subtilisin-like domain-containing protein [Chengkuizengella axinellae]|uniref:Phage tail sheath subtilisin-like domain-containing protein n=1 Tax=Chengkuizengella axinellae TaxID=3064388 RepID=A0ABT9J290_9BACL|nr:phage tail sheath subtilisin-like domain-containing protein [Chengkuizengella sp. 2205SS18-9]MDP5275705.1 phage tail sheath subtilisin-like domain-containing protein [Chengkuizengella sp. 2205SS18-9]